MVNFKWPRSRFFDWGGHIGGMILITAVLTSLAFAFGSWRVTVREHDAALAQATREQENLTTVISEQIRQSFTAVNVILDSVADDAKAANARSPQEFRERLSGQELHQRLVERMKGIPQLDVITLVDTSGDVFNFTRSYPPSPPINLSDRDYFIAHKTGTPGGVFISRPVQNRGNGAWAFYLSRSIRNADGELVGLVLAGLKISFFEEFFQKIRANSSTAFSLFRDDGVLLARYPQAEAAIGRSYADDPTFRAMKDSPSGLTVVSSNFRAAAPDDTVKRMITRKPVESLPLIANMIQNLDVIYAERLENTGTFMARAALVIVMILGLGILTFMMAQGRRRVERALDRSLAEARQSRAVLIDAMESIPDAFGLFDAQDRLILCNRKYAETFTEFKSFEEIAGWRFEDLVRASIAKGEVIDPEFAHDPEAWIQERVRRHRSLDGPQNQVQLGDGRWLQISERPTSNNGIVGVRTDVTELKRAQQLAEAANRAKSEFLSTMSHELRTPLNAIIGFSEVIQGEMYGPVGKPVYKEYAGDINASGRLLLSIISEVLDFAKAEAGKLTLDIEDVELADLAKGVVRLVQQQAKDAMLSITLELPDRSPVIRGDVQRIQQVLLNLLSNAIKFTPPGGRITVLVAQAENLEISLEVRDTGIGIGEKDLKRVFEPFFQAETGHSRRHEGTGLGLAVCDRLVKLHGGNLVLKSEEGQGTLATVIFPPASAVRRQSAPV